MIGHERRPRLRPKRRRHAAATAAVGSWLLAVSTTLGGGGVQLSLFATLFSGRWQKRVRGSMRTAAAVAASTFLALAQNDLWGGDISRGTCCRGRVAAPSPPASRPLIDAPRRRGSVAPWSLLVVAATLSDTTAVFAMGPATATEARRDGGAPAAAATPSRRPRTDGTSVAADGNREANGPQRAAASSAALRRNGRGSRRTTPGGQGRRLR